MRFDHMILRSVCGRLQKVSAWLTECRRLEEMSELFIFNKKARKMWESTYTMLRINFNLRLEPFLSKRACSR